MCCFRALAKKPEDRFANMGEFAASLEALASEPTVVAQHPSLSQPLWPVLEQQRLRNLSKPPT